MNAIDLMAALDLPASARRVLAHDGLQTREEAGGPHSKRLTSVCRQRRGVEHLDKVLERLENRGNRWSSYGRNKPISRIKGYATRYRGVIACRNLVRPRVSKSITISGAPGDDAKHYQIRAVKRAVEESTS